MKKMICGIMLIFMLLPADVPAAVYTGHTGSVLNQGRAAVLMYHLISENKAEWSDYCIAPAKLEQDIKALLAGEYRFIKTKDLRGSVDREKKYVVLTFDDGYDSDYTYVYPLLKKYKVPAVFFLVGSYIGRPQYLNQEQIAEMAQSEYVEFGNHSYEIHNKTAKQVTQLYEKVDTVLQDYQKNDAVLTAMTGTKITALSYPYGINTRPIDAGLKETNKDLVTFTTRAERFEYPYTGQPVGRINRADSVQLKDLLRIINME